ncbi:MAG: VWA domain-containing protein [Candidatus Methanomethylophilaceae archaeon]
MVAQTVPILKGQYPFPAIVGHERVKKALLCAMVSDDVTGVLIMGGAGSAKSTLVRSLASIRPELRLHNIPLNIGEDRLVGGMDMEHAIRSGNKRYMPGILKEADNGLIYLDEINLFEEPIVHKILDVAERKVNEVQREGVSGKHDCDFRLVGTMDPLEGGLSPHLLDRFDICVKMESILDRESRMEILRRRLWHENDPEGLLSEHREELEGLQKRLEDAKSRIPYIIFPDCFYETISHLCLELNVEGHRGDMAMVRVSRALAALDGRDQVCLDDLHEAAAMCLQHRRRDPHDEKRQQTERGDSQSKDERSPGREDIPLPEPPSDPTSHSGDSGGGCGKEDVFSMGDPFVVIDFLKPEDRMVDMYHSRGKRGSMQESEGHGRYRSFRVPTGPVSSVAMVPTLRAAAPYQRFREKKNTAIVLEASDIREKVRTARSTTTMLFLVDSSGSMGARRRMVAVKGAVLSLLKDAYQKRDAVGMMSFREESAELLLPPTKSIDLAFHKLRQMPTGGKTPLALGLSKAAAFLTSERLREVQDKVLVILSDGRANVPLNGKDAFSDALEVAGRLSSLPLKYIVVDTGPAFPRIDRAERLGSALGATYFRLEDLDSESLASSLRLAMDGC